MPERRYEPLEPITREEATELLRIGAPGDVAETLFRICWFDSDWLWVRGVCLEHLTSKEEFVRYAAATCLSDLARTYPDRTWWDLVPRLRAGLDDPEESVVNGMEGALEFIKKFSPAA